MSQDDHRPRRMRRAAVAVVAVLGVAAVASLALARYGPVAMRPWGYVAFFVGAVAAVAGIAMGVVRAHRAAE